MGARRFFVENAHALGDLVPIVGSDAHKIVHVLRLRDGDSIELVDSSAHAFDAKLEIAGERVGARLERVREAAPRDGVVVDVAQGVPKGQKMDFVVEKLTELGVAEILPLVSERTVVRDVGDAKLERWRRLARGAAQQSGRSDIPAVAEPIAFDELLARMGSYDLVLLPWEVAEPENLRERLARLLAEASRVLVVIGPEGGFSHAEAERAQAAGAQLVSLGSRILRSETAGLVTLVLVRHHTSK
ncbi:MAG: 16S rRNA (uracil(1498)-N(3))-methyltransferase [bacterium]|nr:16S rRNA (uracil(1498)-N(3))-methyltransferase [bacterium]